MTPLFVYGTLKRGCKSHHLLSRHQFLGEARTLPGYRLHRLDGYPGLVPHPDAPGGVCGEVWLIDDHGIRELDAFEGIAEGLYRRESVSLQPPHTEPPVQAYVYARTVEGCPVLGSTWVD